MTPFSISGTSPQLSKIEEISYLSSKRYYKIHINDTIPDVMQVTFSQFPEIKYVIFGLSAVTPRSHVTLACGPNSEFSINYFKSDTAVLYIWYITAT
jgi:hypothetical protein